jgi:flagellar protein FliO/FliZ
VASILEALGALALIVAMILASGRLLGRRGPRPAGVQSAQLRILARTSVGAKSSLLVVEAAGRRLLIGLGPQGPVRLAHLGEAPEPPSEVEVIDVAGLDDPEAAILAAFGERRASVLMAVRTLLSARRAHLGAAR